MPSDTSNLMVAGNFLKDLKSSTDIAVTRLLTVCISRGGGGGGGGGVPFYAQPDWWKPLRDLSPFYRQTNR